MISDEWLSKYVAEFEAAVRKLNLLSWCQFQGEVSGDEKTLLIHYTQFYDDVIPIPLDKIQQDYDPEIASIAFVKSFAESFKVVCENVIKRIDVLTNGEAKVLGSPSDN